jgi:hypothetical protein
MSKGIAGYGDDRPLRAEVGQLQKHVAELQRTNARLRAALQASERKAMAAQEAVRRAYAGFAAAGGRA